MTESASAPVSWKESKLVLWAGAFLIFAFFCYLGWILVSIWQKNARISAHPATALGYTINCGGKRDGVAYYEFEYRGERYQSSGYMSGCTRGRPVRVELNALNPDESRPISSP